MRKFHTDYNIQDDNDRKKYIKSLNNRLKAIANTFGEASTRYDKLKKDLIVQLEPRGLKYYENKNGIIQINESKENIENDLMWNFIDKKKYLNMETPTETLKNTFKKMKERGELPQDAKYDKMQMITYTNEYMAISEYVANNLSYLYTGTESTNQALDIMHIRGRRKTYEELRQVSKVISDETLTAGF